MPDEGRPARMGREAGNDVEMWVWKSHRARLRTSTVFSGTTTMVRLPDRFGDFFEANDNELHEVETLGETFIVTLATALYIERQLDRAPEPGWIEFHDLFGARHRVVAWQVRRITATTPATRAAWRAFKNRGDRC